MDKKIRILIVGDDTDKKVAGLIKEILAAKGIGVEIVTAQSAVQGVDLQKLLDADSALKHVMDKMSKRRKKNRPVKECNSKKVKKGQI